METGSDRRDTGDGGPLASSWICSLLAGDFQDPTSAGPQERFERGTGLIVRMVVENPTWGAPRIHGELLMLGFDVSERTILRWMRRAPRDPKPAKRWLAFL